MNEELKPSALSSGPVEGNDKQDERPSFATPDDLNNFLVRRQLLAMEGRRIEDLLIEAEAELRAKQDHLVDICDRARDQLDHLDELARVESLRRRSLENLPRTVERYIRRRGKKLFAYLKPPTSTVMMDRPVAVRVQDPRWHLPKVRQLDAWAAWFAENDPNVRKVSRFRKDRIQVALVVSGGIGDLLKSTHLVGSVSERFSCDLTIIAAQRVVGEVVAHNPYVNDTMVPTNQDVFGFVERLRHIPIFDLIIVWRYEVQYITPPCSRIARNDVRSVEEDSSSLRRVLETYYLTRGRPTFFFALSREMTRLGLSAMKVSVATSGLLYRNLDELPFFPSNKSLIAIEGLLRRPYVTVHHGFDSTFLPTRTRKTEYGSTKNISMQQWCQIVSLILEEGVEVIQLGVVEEEKIEGVTHCLNGQTSFEETGLLIKHGLCHIDTEGGLVHLANAVHGRCVVLFGPTPVEFFGYPQNINLEPSGCKACWFVTQNWLIECPRHTDGPECMSGHSATSVADAAKRIITESENLSAKLIVAEARYSPTPLADMVATAQTLLSRDAANRILLILDYLPSDIGSELSDSVLDGSDVIICAGERPALEPTVRVAYGFEYGSLLNLPRPSSSIDAVAWVSREAEAGIAPFALREIFRVLKPGGQLVFTALGESTGLDLRQSLLAGRITFEEDEMPSTPVYSCCLRKNGAQAKGVPSHSGLAPSVRNPETAQWHSNADDPRLAPFEEENRRQITLVRDSFTKQDKVIDETRAVVDAAVQRGFGGDGWIRISNHFAEGYPTKFFMRGWRSASDWVIWSRENKCLLALPFDEEQFSRGRGLELQLHLVLPQTSASNPTTIGVRVNDGPIESFHLSTDDEILTVRSPTNASKFRGVSLVEFHLDAPITAAESERLHRGIQMGVKGFRYRPLSNWDEQSFAKL